MAKNPLSTLWPSKTLDLREPRLEGKMTTNIPKVKPPKVKMVGLGKLSNPFKRFGA